MTLHPLHAGDGYTYLTRQVASGDVERARGESLTDYYTHDGNPPGRWLGAGLESLGVSGQVSEEQMKALFGEGLHPDADRIGKALVGRGIEAGLSMEQAVEQALDQVRLGAPFRKFKEVDDDGFDVALSAAYAQFRVENDRSPEPGVERDLIRWNVGRQIVAARGADRGRGGEPADADVARYLASRGAEQRRAVAGYDLSFTPVKSVTTLWGLGDERVRSEIARAHEVAWRSTVKWLESEAALTRVGAGGVAQVDTRGFLAVAFDHMDSRLGDPDLHTHVAISGKVQRLDGQWRALDGRVLHRLNVAASERYNTLIETEVRARLGVEFVEESRGRGKQPVREIAGVPKALRDAFSRRRSGIEQAYDDLVAAYRTKHGHEPPKAMQYRLAQQATLATRAAKDEGVRLSVRRRQWRATAARVLGSEEAVDEMVRAVQAPDVDRAAVQDAGELIMDDLAREVLDNLASSRAVWRVGNVQAEAQRVARTWGAGVDGVDVTALADDLADEVLRLSVPLSPPDLNPVPAGLRRADGTSVYLHQASARFTSSEVLAAEDRLVGAARTPGGFVVDAAAVAKVTRRHATRTVLDKLTVRKRLNAGQVELVERFATGGHLIEAGIGPAGTGKTTAMNVFARVVAKAGGRVVGLAPSAAAAAVLREEVGVDADTLHKLLHVYDNPDFYPEIPAHLRLDARTILLVDEAGMAATGDLDRLVALAAEHGAAVRLLGDPAQLQAVEAGGALRLIETEVGAAHLSEVRRFTDPLEAAASLRLREGHASAIDFYVDADRVRGGTREAMIEDLYATWQAATAGERTAVMVAASNADVAVLNARARLDRVVEGAVERDGVALHDESTAGVGDTIVTRTNKRTLVTTGRGTEFVKNGDLWTVTALHPDGSLTVKHLAHRGTVVLPAWYVADSVELGYAATINRVQGMTVDESFTLAETGMTREQLYTGMTRGRDSNRVFVAVDELLDPDLHHDTAPARAARDALVTMVERGGLDTSAVQALNDEYDHAESLARLVPEYEDAYARVWDAERDERLGAVVREILPTTMAEKVLTDEAWPVLRDRLAAHEAARANPAEVLAGAVGGRGLEDAESIARVLHHRLGVAGHVDGRDLPEWIAPVPTVRHRVAPPTIEAPAGEAPTVAPTSPEVVPTTGASGQPHVSAVDPARARVLEANEAAWEFWRAQAATADDWTGEQMAARGLGAVVVGRAPEAWDALYGHMRAAGFSDDDLLTAGLVKINRHGKPYDLFRGRVVLPVYDGEDLVAFTARVPRGEVKVPNKYVNSPATPAYTKARTLYGLDTQARERLAAGARPVLVEGAVDVEAVKTIADQARVLGIDLVPVASLGTAVTGEHLDMLRGATRGGLRDLIVATDGDAAGREAAARIWRALTPAEASTARGVVFAAGRDPGDLVEAGEGTRLLTALVSAPELTTTVVDGILSSRRLDSIEASVNAVREIAAQTAHLELPARVGVLEHAREQFAAHEDWNVSGETITALFDEAHRPQPTVTAPTAHADLTVDAQGRDVDVPQSTVDVGADPYAGLVPDVAEAPSWYDEAPYPDRDGERDVEPTVRAVETVPEVEDVERAEIRRWITAHADLIAARLDALVDEAATGRPAWTRHLRPIPADPIAAATWRAEVRQIVAYRDRYQITGEVPVPAGAGRGVEEQARVAAEDAFARVRAQEPGPARGSGPASKTATRLEELTRKVAEQTRRRNLESLEERVRRQTQTPSPYRHTDDPRREGPTQGGPQM